MSHAENNMSNGVTSKPLVNGATPQTSSKTINHITSYPVVHDSISFYKSQPIGASSINFAQALHDRFVAPIIPHLRGPYSYVSPYVTRADDIGDSSLSSIDSHFPIVKEDSETVKDVVIQYALFPLRVAKEGKDYAVKTWDEEYSKSKNEGILGLVKAGLRTELRVAGDAYITAVGYLKKGKEAGEKKAGQVNEKVNQKVIHN